MLRLPPISQDQSCISSILFLFDFIKQKNNTLASLPHQSPCFHHFWSHHPLLWLHYPPCPTISSPFSNSCSLPMAPLHFTQHTETLLSKLDSMTRCVPVQYTYTSITNAHSTQFPPILLLPFLPLTHLAFGGSVAMTRNISLHRKQRSKQLSY